MDTAEEQEFHQSHVDLYSDIRLRLQENRCLPVEERIETVALALKDVNPERLLHYAACSLVLADAAIESSDASNELVRSTKSVQQADRAIRIVGDVFVDTIMDYFKSIKEQRTSANKARTEKFKGTEAELKQHWQDNIHRDKKATDAAILLEKTDIFKQSDPQPKRSTLERYVREWQKEN